MRRKKNYLLLRIRLPLVLEEDFAVVLWSHGSLGCEIQPAEAGWSTIVAYFPEPATESAVRAIPALLEPWQSQGVQLLDSEHLADQDWLASYRRQAIPFDIGRFRIDPRDEGACTKTDTEEPLAADRVLLRIPARSAFGTGSHASTQLVLQWLESLSLHELEILDVGTGSAILALAALNLGACRVVGFDADPQAVCIASQNGRLNREPLNGRFPALFAGRLNALKAEPRFDLALVNILPERILDELPMLLTVIKPGARVISSGNLLQSRYEVLTFWHTLGFELEGEKSSDEWTSFLLRFTSRP